MVSRLLRETPSRTKLTPGVLQEDKPPPELEFLDLFLFNQKDVKWFEERGCELVKISMEPGDFVLWDSRTVRWVAPPGTRG